MLIHCVCIWLACGCYWLGTCCRVTGHHYMTLSLTLVPWERLCMDDGMAFLVSLRATNIGLKATNIDLFFGVGRHVGAC